MNRLLVVALLSGLLSNQVAGQEVKDVAFEMKLLAEIGETLADVSKEAGLCEKRDEACSLRRLSRMRHELADLVADAEALRAQLIEKQREAEDPDAAELLAARATELLRKIKDSRKALVAAIPASPDALSEEDKAKAAEKLVVDEITKLSGDVSAEAALCEGNDDDCSRKRLSSLRFELHDRLKDAEKRRAALLKKEESEEDPDKAELLSKRAADLLRGINVARKITFDSQKTEVAGDDLLDTVKALGQDLDTKVDSKAAKPDVRKAESTLAAAERKLREQGIADREQVAKLEKKLASGTLESAQYAAAADKKEHLETRIEATEELVTLPSKDNPLFRSYDDDHEDWWIHEFYAGMEFDSVSGIFSKGFARIGYSSSLHVGGEHIPDSRPERGLRLGYGRFYEFNALLSSSAEQSFQSAFDSEADVSDPCQAGYTGSERCIRKALEVEQKLFWPIYRTARHNRVRPYFGPVISFGARFVDPLENSQSTPATASEDPSSRADYRVYVGSHFGFARDAYGEILYGRTRSLESRRIEVRGEIPVAHFGNDSRLLLGWSANLGAGHRRRARAGDTASQSERDVFRVFVVYDLDFLKLPIGIKPPKAEE